MLIPEFKSDSAEEDKECPWGNHPVHGAAAHGQILFCDEKAHFLQVTGVVVSCSLLVGMGSAQAYPEQTRQIPYFGIAEMPRLV